jgi:hypothetical protein
VQLGNGTDELYFSPHKEDSPDNVGSSAGGCETTIVVDTGIVSRGTSFDSTHELTGMSVKLLDVEAHIRVSGGHV